MILIFASGASASQRCQALFLDAEGEILERVAARLDPRIVDETTSALLKILNENLKGTEDSVMTENQFNRILVDLQSLATKNGIRISSTVDTIGVFPESLTSIKISGFSETKGTDEPVNFAFRHELAHLFHVIQVRVILLKAIDRSALDVIDGVDFLDRFEGGFNYYRFERAVTEISGSLHIFSSEASDNRLYLGRVRALVNGVGEAMQNGRLDLPVGIDLFGIYARFLSKAPLVVGKSMKEASIRIPFAVFAFAYIFDDDFRRWVRGLL